MKFIFYASKEVDLLAVLQRCWRKFHKKYFERNEEDDKAWNWSSTSKTDTEELYPKSQEAIFVDHLAI